MSTRRFSSTTTAAVLISALKPTTAFLAPSVSLFQSVFVPSTGTPSSASSFCLSSSSSPSPFPLSPSRSFGFSAASSAIMTASYGVSTEIPTERNMAVASSTEAPILEPKGNHYPWYSMKPLYEAGEFGKAQGLYFKKCKEASGGAPIYKMHPGLACIAITDHASTKWFMSQPDTVLDRQDGAYFGPLKCSKDYLGDSLPPLITNMKESHSEVRAYMIDVMRERVGGTQKALTHASDNFYEHLKNNGLGDHPTVYDTFLRQSYAIILEWALGTGEQGGQPLPPFEDFVNVNPIDVNLLLGVEIDTPVASFAVQALQKLKGGGATKEQKKSVKVLLDSITSSKAWTRFMEVLKKNNVPITELERAFMFNTGFQSSVPMAKSMECAIAALNDNPDFLKDLQDELDGQDLTMAAVGDLSRFPLLDSFHWEILRMFPAPPFYCKKAKVDLVVPTSNGDRYQIRKGDMLFCHQAIGQIDELKFGPDARQFNPRRFVGNQDLKKDIFAYAYPDSTDPSPKDGMPWGCVAHAIGILDSLLKVFYGRWIQEYTWEMAEPTVIDPDLFLAKAGPTGMAFSKITPRK